MSPRPPLENLRVMVTRPVHLAAHLSALLERAGADVIRRPCMEIVDCGETPENLALVHDLRRYRLVVFVSRNAVEAGFNLLRGAGVSLPADVPVAAVGVKTGERLALEGVASVVNPVRAAGSEALLETAAVKSLDSGRVLVFRGEGGNELLANTLRARGVEVDYAEVYRRRKPSGVRLLFGTPDDPDVILSASAESLQNLYDLTAPASRDALTAITVALGSAAMAGLHEHLGFRTPPVIARSPVDEDMLDAVVRWWRKH